MNIIEETLAIGDKTLTLQTGKLAQATDISILGRMGDTCVLVTVVVGPERTDIDYFPLFVEYVEKLYAGGRIKGSRWVKREGKPSDEAVLTGRLIDRSVRPLFPKNYKRQVQIIITLLSVDGSNSPEIVSAITTSAALHASSIPWNGPISTIRMGYIKTNDDSKGTLVVNPDEEDQKFSQLDLVVSSTKEKVLMIEAKAEVVQSNIVIEAIEKAHESNQIIIDFIDKLRGKIKKQKHTYDESDPYSDIIQLLQTNHDDAINTMMSQKEKKDEIKNTIVDNIYKTLEEKFDKKQIEKAITSYTYQKIRENILKNKIRPDGRSPDQIRDIYAEISVFPRTHGSALFQRGETQALSIATLGSPTLEQLIEGPEGE